MGGFFLNEGDCLVVHSANVNNNNKSTILYNIIQQYNQYYYNNNQVQMFKLHNIWSVISQESH